MNDLHDSELYQTVLEGLRFGVFLLDQQRKIFFWNDGAEEITGYHRHEVLGHISHDNILDQCNDKACASCANACPFTSSLCDGKVNELRIQLHHKDGYLIPVRLCVTPIRNSRGGVIGLAQSFDEQKFAFDRDRRQHNLSEYGCLDDMTGLPNRSFTQFHLRENWEGFKQYHLPFGIVCIQLDKFKEFKGNYGREACDSILHVLAQTVRNSMRPSDFLGRWKDDEFLGILPNCTPRGVHTATERIGRLLSSAGLQWWGDRIEVSTQIGEAAVQADDTLESLLSRANSNLKIISGTRAAAASGGSINS
ncbi:MAG TPA: sensor domain-containing diguanylate cyclase [Terriglobales bacterium]|jgi:diguanylate cyclase (GGDEF)-like protein/PAS domain S-box-containing protein|nr:sensor domain-containing diguanylate cyclase [Terriglobales bacterium]